MVSHRLLRLRYSAYHVYFSKVQLLKNRGGRHRTCRRTAKALVKENSDDDPPIIMDIAYNGSAGFTVKSKFGTSAFITAFSVRCRSPPLSFIFGFSEIKKMEDTVIKIKLIYGDMQSEWVTLTTKQHKA